MAISSPNYTQIPNEVLDRMHEMTPAEFMVLSAICRKTFGWQKSEDVISLTQLQKMTGLSRTAVQGGIMAGLERGMLERRQVGTQSFSYHLLVASHYQSTQTTSSGGGPDPVASDYQQLVASDYSQKKGLKKLKETSSMSPPAPVLRLIPGGRGGGGEEEEKEIDDEGETDEGTTALVDECELESDERRKAELVDQLVALRLWRSSAVEAVEAGTVATNHDIVCCKRFCESSRLENPAGSLWSNWLSAGQVPPIPQMSDADPRVIDAARRLSADLDRQREQGSGMIDQRALDALKARQGRGVLKTMPSKKPAFEWRST